MHYCYYIAKCHNNVKRPIQTCIETDSTDMKVGVNKNMLTSVCHLHRSLNYNMNLQICIETHSCVCFCKKHTAKLSESLTFMDVTGLIRVFDRVSERLIDSFMHETFHCTSQEQADEVTRTEMASDQTNADATHMTEEHLYNNLASNLDLLLLTINYCIEKS